MLIHSATGAAEIAITRAAGAEIFATAGSEQRRQLVRNMGIEHVYDPRNIQFAEATAARGRVCSPSIDASLIAGHRLCVELEIQGPQHLQRIRSHLQHDDMPVRFHEL